MALPGKKGRELPVDQIMFFLTMDTMIQIYEAEYGMFDSRFQRVIELRLSVDDVSGSSNGQDPLAQMINIPDLAPEKKLSSSNSDEDEGEMEFEMISEDIDGPGEFEANEDSGNDEEEADATKVQSSTDFLFEERSKINERLSQLHLKQSQNVFSEINKKKNVPKKIKRCLVNKKAA